MKPSKELPMHKKLATGQMKTPVSPVVKLGKAMAKVGSKLKGK